MLIRTPAPRHSDFNTKCLYGYNNKYFTKTNTPPHMNKIKTNISNRLLIMRNVLVLLAGRHQMVARGGHRQQQPQRQQAAAFRRPIGRHNFSPLSTRCHSWRHGGLCDGCHCSRTRSAGEGVLVLRSIYFLFNLSTGGISSATNQHQVVTRGTRI